MGGFNRDDRSGGGFKRGFGRGGGRDSGRGGFGGNRGGFNRGRSSFGSDRGPREMFKTTCSNCGKECEVPFKPTNGKPVYCSDCFEKMGNGGRSDAPRQERTDFRPQAQSSNQSNIQLEALNAKLDRIISLLEPKKADEDVKPLETKGIKKTVKKASKKE